MEGTSRHTCTCATRSKPNRAKADCNTANSQLCVLQPDTYAYHSLVPQELINSKLTLSINAEPETVCGSKRWLSTLCAVNFLTLQHWLLPGSVWEYDGSPLSTLYTQHTKTFAVFLHSHMGQALLPTEFLDLRPSRVCENRTQRTFSGCLGETNGNGTKDGCETRAGMLPTFWLWRKVTVPFRAHVTLRNGQSSVMASAPWGGTIIAWQSAYKSMREPRMPSESATWRVPLTACTRSCVGQVMQSASGCSWLSQCMCWAQANPAGTKGTYRHSSTM